MRAASNRLLWVAGAVFAATLCRAADPATHPTIRIRSLAATCGACHGTDGHAARGAHLRLAGLPSEYIRARLLEYRAGTRPPLVMQQIAKGFTDVESDELARYFAAQE